MKASPFPFVILPEQIAQKLVWVGVILYPFLRKKSFEINSVGLGISLIDQLELTLRPYTWSTHCPSNKRESWFAIFAKEKQTWLL